jgi:multidrug efflux pump subunit AcrB
MERRPAAWVMARIGDQPQAYEKLRIELERLPVDRVEACGVREARLALELVPSKLTAMGLTLHDVVLTFQGANIEIPAGQLTTDEPMQTIRLKGELASLDAISDMVVGAGGVRTRDVAVITQRSEAECLVDGAPDPETPALLRIGLRSPKDRVAVEKAMKKLGLAALKDAAAFTTPGRPRRVTLVAAPVGPVVEAVLVGDDATALADAGKKALEAARAAPGVAAAWCHGCEVDASEQLEIDRDAADARKVVPAKVAEVVRAAMVGEHVSTYRDGDLEIEVIVSVEEGGAQWRAMPIRSDEGKVYPLEEVVRVTKTSGLRDILHVDRRRAVAVWLRGGAKTSAGELQKILKAALPGARVRTVPPASVGGEPW